MQPEDAVWETEAWTLREGRDESQDEGSGAVGGCQRLGPGMKEEVVLKDKGVEEPDRGPESSRSHQRGSETDRARQINEVERPGGGDS